MAQDVSVFCYECVCGKSVKSPTLKAVCPHCRRAVTLTWPAEYNPPRELPAIQSAVNAGGGQEIWR